MAEFNHNPMGGFDAQQEAKGPSPSRPVPARHAHVVNIKPDFKVYDAMQHSQGGKKVYLHAPDTVDCTSRPDFLTAAQIKLQRTILASRKHELLAVALLTKAQEEQEVGDLLTDPQDSHIGVIATPALLRTRDGEKFEVVKARFQRSFRFAGMALGPSSDDDRKLLGTMQISGTFNFKHAGHVGWPLGSLLRMSFPDKFQLAEGCGDDDAKIHKIRPHFIPEVVTNKNRDMDFWPDVQIVLKKIRDWAAANQIDEDGREKSEDNMNVLMTKMGTWNEDKNFVLAEGMENKWCEILCHGNTPNDYPLLDYPRNILSWVINLVNISTMDSRDLWRSEADNVAAFGPALGELLINMTHEKKHARYASVWKQFHIDFRGSCMTHDQCNIGYLAAGGNVGGDVNVHSVLN